MNYKDKKGFTLIELLVVIAIIGILSSVVLASLNSARLKSRDARRISDIKQIQLALELYFDSNANYPVTTLTLVPTYIATNPTDPTTGAIYTYSALGSGSTCSSYHLATKLENSSHAVLSSDIDAMDATDSVSVCTGGGTAFDGTDPLYDVKP